MLAMSAVVKPKEDKGCDTGSGMVGPHLSLELDVEGDKPACV